MVSSPARCLSLFEDGEIVEFIVMPVIDFETGERLVNALVEPQCKSVKYFRPRHTGVMREQMTTTYNNGRTLPGGSLYLLVMS